MFYAAPAPGQGTEGSSCWFLASFSAQDGVKGVTTAHVRPGAAQVGQQLLLGAYQALEQQVEAGTVTMHPRTEMLDLVVIGNQARRIFTRDLRTGAVPSPLKDR